MLTSNAIPSGWTRDDTVFAFALTSVLVWMTPFLVAPALRK